MLALVLAAPFVILVAVGLGISARNALRERKRIQEFAKKHPQRLRVVTRGRHV